MAISKKEYLELLQRSALDGIFPAYDRDERACQYLTSDGRKCAVGVLIPNKLCLSKYNNYLMEKLVGKHGPFRPYIPEGLDSEDLVQIQATHDNLALVWSGIDFIRSVRKLECFADVVDFVLEPVFDD